MKYDKNNDPKWIGQKFGALTVVDFVHKNRVWHWRCRCDCGNEIVTIAGNVKQGLSKSCGCVAAKKASERLTKHGMSRTRLANTFANMKSRCYNPKDKFYKDWGGRGIKIYDEWLSDRTKFYEWAMSNGYKEDLSIERIDVNGDYCPENCCWIPVRQQAWNRRNSRMFTYNGERKCLSEWCKVLNVDERVVRARISRGASFEEAITAPVKKGVMAQKCREAGVNYHTVISRMRNHGMSFEEALSAPFMGKTKKDEHI